jgi:hypothetical protein
MKCAMVNAVMYDKNSSLLTRTVLISLPHYFYMVIFIAIFLKIIGSGMPNDPKFG